MSRKFRKWSPDQTWLLPPSPRDWLESDHLVYLLLDVVGEMDLSPFFERYRNSVTGQPPYHPRMMVTLLLYGYCSGVFSSRKIQARCGVEEAAREKAAAHVAKMEAEGRKHRADPEKAVPHEKDQRNFTDPDSKIMRTSNMVEPVFGQITECRGFRQFLLRGLENMQGEWTLVCLTHNLLKAFRTQPA